MRPSRTSTRRRRTAAAVLLAALSLLTLDGAAMAARGDGAGRSGDERSARFATFNASLNRAAEGQLVADLSTPDNVQAQAVAEVIQRTRPDVLLINEFDFDAERRGRCACSSQLPVGRPQRGQTHPRTAYRFVAPSNTGIPSGFDLNNDGTVGGPDDAFGFGVLPGPVRHGGLLALPDRLRRQSAPSSTSSGRTCRERCCPTTRPPRPGRLVLARGAGRVPAVVQEPLGPADPGRAARSSTSWSATRPRRSSTVPRTATGRRNHDEIRFWADYVLPGAQRLPLRRRGRARRPQARASRFVIAGDQNADPFDGDSVAGAAQQLLDNPRVNTSRTPTSAGGPEQAAPPGWGQPRPTGATPAFDTADFADCPARQPARRLRPAEQDATHPRRRRVLAAVRRPAVPAGRRLPVPHLRPPSGLGRCARAQAPLDRLSYGNACCWAGPLWADPTGGEEAGEDPLDSWGAGRIGVGGSEGEGGWRACGWRGGGAGRVHGWVAPSSPWRQFGAPSTVRNGCRFRSGPEEEGKMPYASLV